MLQLLQGRKRCQLQREGLEPVCSCLKITSWTKSQSDFVEHVRPLFISRSFLSYWQSCEVSNCPIILYGHRSKKSTKCRFQFCPGKCYRPSWLSYRWTASFSIAWINDDSVDDMTTYPVYCSDGFCDLVDLHRAEIMQASGSTNLGLTALFSQNPVACSFLWGPATDGSHKYIHFSHHSQNQVYNSDPLF